MIYKRFSVFLNDNIASHSVQRGVSRYFRTVTDGIVTHYGDQVIIFSSEASDYGRATHIPTFNMKGRRRVRAREITGSIATLLTQPSVVFSPYYGRMWTRVPEVFTVYDMIYELFPHYFPRGSQYNSEFITEKRRCIERAAALIAISESTAADIRNCYPYVEASKITVVHLGVDEFFFEAQHNQKRLTEKPYFVYVGHRNTYKNFMRLLAAFGQSGLARDFDLRVISPSTDGFSAQETECLDRYGLHKSVELINNASETRLRDSYANAVAFVYPSEYEGFGLPILEAMASGTIVATSNTSSLLEVGGNVAYYFDPYSEEAMAFCLQQLVNLSTDERQSRIVQGRDRARTFSWMHCQEQTNNVLQQFM